MEMSGVSSLNELKINLAWSLKPEMVLSKHCGTPALITNGEIATAPTGELAARVYTIAYFQLFVSQ